VKIYPIYICSTMTRIKNKNKRLYYTGTSHRYVVNINLKLVWTQP